IGVLLGGLVLSQRCLDKPHEAQIMPAVSVAFSGPCDARHDEIKPFLRFLSADFGDVVAEQVDNYRFAKRVGHADTGEAGCVGIAAALLASDVFAHGPQLARDVLNRGWVVPMLCINLRMTHLGMRGLSALLDYPFRDGIKLPALRWLSGRGSP